MIRGPYSGLRAFNRQENVIFFGRDDQVGQSHENI